MKEYAFVKEMWKSDELIGRREELQSLKESMYKKRMKNSILIGAAGCGKTAILEQFAYDMRNLFNVLELDIGACVAGTTLRGQFEEKLISFLDEVSAYNAVNNKKIILFIDEIHTLYRAGGADGAIDASNILKSYLSRGDVIIIGATTNDEYNATISRDNALKRRLSPIFIKQMDEKTIIAILKKFNEGLLSDEMIDFIYQESLLLEATNPDAAIEILDKCMAKKKYTGNEIKALDVKKIVKNMKEK